MRRNQQGASAPARDPRTTGPGLPVVSPRAISLTVEVEIPALVAPRRLVAETRLEFRRVALNHVDLVVQRRGTHVTVDLRHTTDIDDSGFGVLLLLQKRARARTLVTTLRHPPVKLRQIIELTKLEYLFEIES